jgi:hypothetical protein
VRGVRAAGAAGLDGVHEAAHSCRCTAAGALWWGGRWPQVLWQQGPLWTRVCVRAHAEHLAHTGQHMQCNMCLGTAAQGFCNMLSFAPATLTRRVTQSTAMNAQHAAPR